MKDSSVYPPNSDFVKLSYEILGCKSVPSSDFTFYLARIAKYANFEEGIYIAA